MQQLAELSFQGVPEWKLDKLILPICLHSKYDKPKGILKFYEETNTLYERAIKDDEWTKALQK